MKRAQEHGAALRNVSRTFGAVEALRDLDLELGPGEILGLTGPSGAGKTTTCRIIAGLEQPDSGAVFIDGKDMRGVPAQHRGVAFMFESYALYPHMSVRENLCFPLQSAINRDRYTRAEIDERVDNLLVLTEMTALQHRRPSELSGGQKQRVALCRALAQEPDIYLLDEPIAHLDAKLRHKLRGEIRQRLSSREAPTLWCTPDAMEAIAVGDRVAVLSSGRLQQLGRPEELYLSPKNVTVAKLVGDPPINLIAGRLQRFNEVLRFEHPQIRVALPESMARRASAETFGDEVILGIRPTSIDIGINDPEAPQAEVYTVEPFGKHSIVTMILGNDRLKAKTFDSVSCQTGEQLRLGLRVGELTLFDGDTGLALN